MGRRGRGRYRKRAGSGGGERIPGREEVGAERAACDCERVRELQPGGRVG